VDVQCQNKLIDEFLKVSMPELSTATLDSVIALNTEINNSIALDELPRKIEWKPLSIKFDNLFTYGEGNILDLTNSVGTIGVFSPNATGKSSLANLICFALYDKTPATNKASSIMNTRKDSCYLEFKFEADGIEYVIIRQGVRDKKR